MNIEIESIIAKKLRTILFPLMANEAIPQSTTWIEFQSTLERFIASLLGWQYESLDGFRFSIARKVGPDQAEFSGLALLITDQTWTPFHLRTRLSPDDDTISAIECYLGECNNETGEIVKTPYDSNQIENMLYHLPQRLTKITWVYQAHCSEIDDT